MFQNPFMGMSIGAWLAFLVVLPVVEFKPWAWMLWVPWLGFATLAPLLWWYLLERKQHDSQR